VGRISRPALATSHQLRPDHPRSPSFLLGAPCRLGPPPDSCLRALPDEEYGGVRRRGAQKSEGNERHWSNLATLTVRRPDWWSGRLAESAPWFPRHAGIAERASRSAQRLQRHPQPRFCGGEVHAAVRRPCFGLCYVLPYYS
jgi:hypothetical protein